VSAPPLVAELAPGIFEIGSVFGARRLHQHLLVGDDGSAVLIDAGVAATPAATLAPALAEVGVAPERLRWLVVTHPDADHQGGAAALLALAPACGAACGFLDLPLVRDPEALIRDRYRAYAREHALDLDAAELAEVRAISGAPVEIDLALFGGEALSLPGRRLLVHRLPGHSAGHLAIEDAASGTLLMADAVHGRRSPALDGGPALPPTYEDVDAYEQTIARVRALAPRLLASGHMPALSGAEIAAFLDDSAAFVAELDALLLRRADAAVAAAGVTLAELCAAADAAFGPFAAGPAMLRFAVHGHVRRLVERGALAAVDLLRTPRRYVSTS